MRFWCMDGAVSKRAVAVIVDGERWWWSWPGPWWRRKWAWVPGAPWWLWEAAAAVERSRETSRRRGTGKWNTGAAMAPGEERRMGWQRDADPQTRYLCS
jgi:hypothetical protein